MLFIILFLYYFILYYIILCYIILCYIMLYYITLYYIISIYILYIYIYIYIYIICILYIQYYTYIYIYMGVVFPRLVDARGSIASSGESRSKMQVTRSTSVSLLWATVLSLSMCQKASFHMEASEDKTSKSSGKIGKICVQEPLNPSNPQF